MDRHTLIRIVAKAFVVNAVIQSDGTLDPDNPALNRCAWEDAVLAIAALEETGEIDLETPEPIGTLALDRELIDHHFPRCGLCAICGDPDARHRIFDAIRGFAVAGDSVEDLAENYDVPVEAIQAVLRMGAISKT